MSSSVIPVLSNTKVSRATAELASADDDFPRSVCTSLHSVTLADSVPGSRPARLTDLVASAHAPLLIWGSWFQVPGSRFQVQGSGFAILDACRGCRGIRGADRPAGHAARRPAARESVRR